MSLTLTIPINTASGPSPSVCLAHRWLLAHPWPQLGTALRFGGVALLACTLQMAIQSPARAGSALLDRVKQNPKVAVAMCSELRGLNAQGISSTSSQAVDRIAVMQGLNKTDAEILTTYVVGLHCPDVR
jgi:hypothetical protein